ncbi:MAG TPA: contractile injection system protein, VgrG/Pvc8 family [Myxococcales bacterium]|nr:contractile injection system protein, VgrG/Pvc8 family [Myxococcales bacterium]
MRRVESEIHVGSVTASTTPRREDRALIRLVSELGMGGAGGRCVLEIAGPSLEPPAPGDPVTVAFGDGQSSTTVFTGEVRQVTRTAVSLRVTAVDGLARLARVDVEAAYEGKTAGAIVQDVLSQAGVDAGTVHDGPTFPSYLLHRGPRALRHLQRLAELCGADLYADGDGKICFATPEDQGAEHTFKYGEHILQLSLENTPPAFDSVVAWGEGAASAKGAGKEHWLISDLSSVSGKAAVGERGTVMAGQEGDRPLQIFDGAVRSGEAAQEVARARAAAVASRAVRGFLVVLGEPSVFPGDTVTIEALPAGRPAPPGPPMRVRRVRHTLEAAGGFTTRMEL